MSVRDEGQSVSRLEAELLEDLHGARRGRRLDPLGAQVVNLNRFHTPATSFQAITCSWGRTRARPSSGVSTARSQSQRYLSPTASRSPCGAGTGVPADR